MCGIVGYVGLGDRALLEKMSASIDYRGPNNKGYFVDGNVGLGHQRLSIVDIGAAGHQPMSNEDGTVWIVFNGEIYNFQDLKEELKERHEFKSKSDTEVIIHLYEELGEEMFSKLNGMWSLAIYDKKQKKLLLARDRMGKKPLYYINHNENFAFASEPKALLDLFDLKKEVDPFSLNLFLFFQYVPMDFSLFKSVKKLLPGHYMVYKDRNLTIKKYWDLQFNDSSAPDINKLESIIEDSVSRRLVSDVPLGVFLSGGLDSSTIAYYAAKNSNKKIKTFSIGFEESSFDETKYAKLVSDFLKTEHRHKQFSEKDFMEVVPKIFSLQDEPVADASMLPTFILSRFTKEYVTVALGGDGADELFCGYPTFQAHKIADVYGRMPNFLYGFVRNCINRLPVSFKNFSLDFELKRFMEGADKNSYWRDMFWMSAFSMEEQQKLFKPEFYNLLNGEKLIGIIEKYFSKSSREPKNKESLCFWQKGYLADDILVKLDRASMYNSLEARSPFLDYRLVEYINNLPLKFKIRGFQTKYLLKKLMSGKLPKNIVYRKKKGFGIPLARWLAGDLKEFLLTSLSKERIDSVGFLDYGYVYNLIDGHLRKKADNRIKIWTLLSFMEWHKRWLA